MRISFNSVFVYFQCFSSCIGEINGLIDDNDDYDKDSIEKRLKEYGNSQQPHTPNIIQR